MSEHLVSPEQVLAFDAGAGQDFLREDEAERAGRARKTYLEATGKAINAIERRRELMDLVLGYRRLKRDLGLMDFSDQIELGARLAVDQPEVGVIERGRFKVVLLDEYQDTSVAQATMLSRLFSGPDAGHGLGHPVTAVGDPNQAIYGWRGASVSNILHFADTFPAADASEADGRRLPAHRQPTLRPTHPRGRQPARPAALRQVRRPGRPPRRRPTTPDAARSPPGSSRPRPTSWPGWPARSTRRHDAGAALVRHRGADPRQRPRCGGLRRPHGREHPRRDRRPLRADPAARGRRGRRHAPPPERRHRQRRAAHPAHRAALGDRAARPPAARPARGRAGGRRRGRASSARSTDQLVEIADGIDPAEIAALGDALDVARRRGVLARGARAVPAAQPPSCGCCARSVGEPLLDVVRRIIDTSGVDIELASAVSPAAAARRDNLDLFVKAVAEFQAVDGDVSLVGAAGLPDRARTTRATVSTSPRRPRPTRSSC